MEGETKLEEERDMEEKNTVIKVMIHRAWHKVGCGKEIDKPIPGRNVTNRVKEPHAKVKNRM